MSIIQGTSKAAGGAGYEIDQSIRFNDDDSARLARTVSSSGSLTTWTLSGWIKRGKYTVNTNGQWFPVFSASAGSTSYDAPFNFNDVSTGGAFNVYIGGYQWRTSALARDTSAWYHVVTVWDSSNGTASDRMRLYINGERVTDFSISATPSSGANSRWNSSSYSHHRIGNLNYNGGETTYVFDGYLSEINFIDGTALDATSFGEYNDDGVWIPKAYDGSYGSNGFYITGETASDLGEDFSGNGNDFTSSGLATTDQMLDTPTNNFCTWNPLRKGPAHTLSDGNLLITSSIADATFGTFMVDSGKWYWEVTILSAEIIVGIGDPLAPPTAAFDTTAAVNSRGYNGYNGQKTNNGTGSAYGATYTTNDVVGVALNMDDGEITFYKNNSSQGVAFTGLTGLWGPAASVGNTRSCRGNFGQSAFTYTPPTGYNALSTANLATPSITDGSAHFQPTLYSGNSSTQEVNQSGNSTFTPGWVWIKARNGAGYSHQLFDQVRGATKRIFSDATSTEATTADTLTSFDSDGFSLGGQVTVNQTGKNMVAWQWKANGAGSSNTDGSLASTVSANTASGFSIVTATPGTSGTDTIGHGLGIAPKMIIGKNVNLADNWHVYHDAISPANEVRLNTTGAATTTTWQSASTSSVFQIINGAWTNGGQVCLFYCFAEIPGYSSIGSYTGNGSATNGPFIYTNGMTPKYVMIKRTNSTGYWDILDTTREPFNSVGNQIFANTSAAEASNDHEMDFVSNGIKIRDASTSVNASGSTYIYMAFAERPFGGDGVAPATAR